MTLAYLTNADAWYLSQGHRSRLSPIVATRVPPPRQPKSSKAAIEAINSHLKALGV